MATKKRSVHAGKDPGTVSAGSENGSRPGTVDEEAVIRRVSFVGILGNVILSAFKLMAGILGHSGAMVSDAVHSMSDVLATAIAWIGVKLARREADAHHPYGHDRFECLASVALGLILAMTGLGIGRVGLISIFRPDPAGLPVPGRIALIAAVVSIVTKEAMFWYTRYYAKVIRSEAFLADAWHHRSDAFSSVGSLIGIAGARMGFPVMDSIASVVICCFILKVAWDITLNSVTRMLDTSCGEDYERELREYVLKHEGVLGVDLLRTRMFGSRVYIDLEIRADGNITVREGHDIAQRIHDDVEARYKNTKHIMIHVNPADVV